MEKHNLMLLKDGYLEGYDDTINPSVATVFTSAAFRMGHTLLPSEIERWSKTHRYVICLLLTFDLVSTANVMLMCIISYKCF